MIAFDGPSHGFSSKAETSLFEFSSLVGLILKKYNPAKIISHSLGGVVTTYALYNNPEIQIDKYLLLTTPDRFDQRIDDIARTVGISEGVKKKLISKVEHELNVVVADFTVSDFVQKINVKSALIIHDENDQIIPINQSATVCANWEVCSIKPIKGTGHFRILSTPSVIKDVVDYMQ